MMRLSLIAFILICMSGVLYFTSSVVHNRLHARTMNGLHEVSRELLAELRSYFHEQIQQAKKIVQDSKLKTLLIQFSSGQKSDLELLVRNIPDQWKDLMIMGTDHQQIFSLRNTIANPLDIVAIKNLLNEVPGTMEPSIGKSAQIAGAQALVPFAFPLIAHTGYKATIVVALDYEFIAQKIRLYQQRLPYGAEIVVGQSERSTVSVLFSSRTAQKPFEITYFIEDPAPIARACNGDFGADDRKYAHQWIASVRAYSPHFHWAVAVQADQTLLYSITTIIWFLSLFSLILGLLLGIYLLVQHFSLLQKNIKPLIFCLFTGGLGLSLLVGYLYGLRYQKTHIDIHESYVSQAKIDIKYVASLLLQHSFALETAVRSKSLEIQKNLPSDTRLSSELQNAIFGISYRALDSQTHDSSYILTKGKKNLFNPVFFDRMMSSTAPHWISGVLQPEFGTDVYHVYVEPFFTKEQQIAGFVWATFSYQEIKNIIEILGQEKSRNTIVFDRQGTTIYEDNFEFVKHRISAYEIEKYFKGAAKVAPAFVDAQGGKSGFLEFATNDGAPWLFLYENLPDMNWSLAMSIPQKELYVPTSDMHWYETIFICCSILFFICLMAIFLKIYEFSLLSLYIFSLSTSLLLIVGIVSLIMSNYRYNDRVYQSHALLSELQVMQARERLEEKTGKTYVPVKTNITLRFIDARSPEKIKFTALIRQSINRDRYPHVKLGVEFANISDIVTTTTLESGKRGAEEYVTYHIQGTTYQAKQNYPQIPFDNEPISLRLRSADHINSVLLVPDFAFYPVLDPVQLPGVLQNFTLKNFILMKSYFLYVFLDNQEREALLTFVLLAQRNWVSIVPEYFLPLAVILMTIYLLSLLDDEVARKKRLNIISALSGLFLSLVLLHQRYRSSLVVTGFSYLEAIIVMVYIALGYGFINVLTLIYRTGLKPYKLALYWPTLLTYMFLITATIFLRAM